jgi:hypothetical protein
MFSFFKKKPHPASELYEHYSDEEKMIILSLLFIAGICDNDKINNNQARIDSEIKYLNTYVNIFNSSAKKSNEFLARIGPEELTRRFINMDDSKTENALLLIVGMLTCDGQMNETELMFLSSLLDKLNISEEEFIERMKKIDALYNYFMK